ncbi:MAG: hypothetical protein JWQ03_3258 [Variovorax sp.]|nr:hypothetical protein [Variovorax sp.]
MHKCLLTVLFLLAISVLQAQYTWSNPQPSGFRNTKVGFATTSIGFIINNDGDLMKTADAGANWNVQQNFSGCDVLEVKDSLLLVAGADSVLYRSADRGLTWQPFIVPQTFRVDGIQALNRDTVYALGRTPGTGATQLHRSADGGRTWQVINNTFAFKGLHFVDSGLGYATTFGGIYKSVDGGISWQKIYNQPSGNPLTVIRFFSRTLGFVYQDLGNVLKTVDGGTTWTPVLSPLDRVVDMAFNGLGSMFLVGNHGIIYRSTDGGATWNLKPYHLADGYTIYSVCLLSPTTGFFVGLRGQILKTVDGGDTYTAYSPTYTDVRPLAFPTPAIGYAGTWSELFKTVDTGRSWQKLPFTIAQDSRWQYLHFFSADTGIALCENPVKGFKTTDGGQTWTTLSFPLSFIDNIEGFFVTGNTVYLGLMGTRNYSLRSIDRGATWRIMGATDNTHNHNYFFTDEKTGWSTAGPYLYKTVDSAKTWSLPVFTGNSNGQTLNTIWFTTPATGFVMGSSAFASATIDSGKTWTSFAVSDGNISVNEIFTLRFFNKNVGFFSSANGGLFRTTDGGKTWSPQKSAPWDSRTLVTTADTTMFIGGDAGIILKKDLREANVDSFRVVADATCGAKLSSKITAVLSTVDSIRYEYGLRNFSAAIAATPSTVRDSAIWAEATLSGLMKDSVYTVRIKYLHRNAYRYSATFTFRALNGLPKPAISFNGSLLSSSATAGNQWFLNGVAINGASNSTYSPVAQGQYTVQQTINGCISPVSNSFSYVATTINDPALAALLTILPNPVNTTVWVKLRTPKRLELTLLDAWGRRLALQSISANATPLDLQAYGPGVYFLLVEEPATHKTTTVKLLKR